MVKTQLLPFYIPVGYEESGRLFHKFCAGEITLSRANKRRRYQLVARCDGCDEVINCDSRTLKRQFPTLQMESRKLRRAELASELQTRPLYPVSKFEDLSPIDFSDTSKLMLFDKGAAMVQENTNMGKVIAIRTSGHFPKIERRPTKQIKLVKTGAVKGKRTRPSPRN